jgi:hypothetical protein
MPCLLISVSSHLFPYPRLDPYTPGPNNPAYKVKFSPVDRQSVQRAAPQPQALSLNIDYHLPISARELNFVSRGIKVLPVRMTRSHT